MKSVKTDHKIIDAKLDMLKNKIDTTKSRLLNEIETLKDMSVGIYGTVYEKWKKFNEKMCCYAVEIKDLKKVLLSNNILKEISYNEYFLERNSKYVIAFMRRIYFFIDLFWYFL